MSDRFQEETESNHSGFLNKETLGTKKLFMSVCPVCRGKGFVEKSTSDEDDHKKETAVTSQKSSSIPDIDLSSDSLPSWIRKAKVKLKSATEKERVEGIVEMTQSARVKSDLVSGYMPEITKIVNHFLRTSNHENTKTACQVADELYRSYSYTMAPDFDELVLLLLSRSVDTHKMIRAEAQSALSTIVTTSPPQSLIRALSSKGASKNPDIRLRSVQILDSATTTLTPHAVLCRPSLRDTRKRLLTFICPLLDDPNKGVRDAVHGLFKKLMSEDAFDEAVKTDLSYGSNQKLERALVLLKYLG